MGRGTNNAWVGVGELSQELTFCFESPLVEVLHRVLTVVWTARARRLEFRSDQGEVTSSEYRGRIARVGSTAYIGQEVGKWQSGFVALIGSAELIPYCLQLTVSLELENSNFHCIPSLTSSHI